MKDRKYDIFISYRRVGGAQYARIIQMMLQQRGYKVFLDYDELTDGIFGDHIRAAIKDAPVFMLILSERSMERCVNEDDWVRQEILLAIDEGKHIVPVNPDNTFDGFPDDTDEKKIPKAMRDIVGSTQFSDIGFGQTLGVTIDLMIKNRLVPTLGERTALSDVATDYESAQKLLLKIDAHNRFIRRLGIAGVALIVLIVFGTCVLFWQKQKHKEIETAEIAALDKLRTSLDEKYRDYGLQLSPDLTMNQMNEIDTMLNNMSEVKQNEMWMSQFEFTIGQWYGVKGIPYDIELKHNPITGVSYGDINMFLLTLSDMTNLNITLPSVEEWEYAAHGGINHETTMYVGSDDVDAVAWYKDNSGGHVHASDGLHGKEPNMLDLYDMSGNVSELCNTAFLPDTDNSPYTVCGGNYKSQSRSVTVNSRAPFDNNAKADTVGFRIIIKKQ